MRRLIWATAAGPRARILEKMNMKTNADLMRYAIQNNLSE